MQYSYDIYCTSPLGFVKIHEKLDFAILNLAVAVLYGYIWSSYQQFLDFVRKKMPKWRLGV
ncbi:hypothetical protein SAMN04488514_107152 [Kriegella aquimaris]|uniref:Uncharacterized protein n=1 Tax=Kriegella aquimaris TaxID=192904 RepID=A0A1G9S9V5_9FLAO|nr:hypothetical protein SAMN04488514_107152 [Kriegella aquimaris]